MAEPNTKNEFFVGSAGGDVVIMKSPQGRITRAQALNLAAWIVAITDPEDEFTELLQAIRNT